MPDYLSTDPNAGADYLSTDPNANEIPDPAIFLKGNRAAEYNDALDEWDRQLQNPLYGMEMMPASGGRLLTKLPGKRMLSAGWEAAKGVGRNLPFVGRPLAAGVRGAVRGWQKAAPKVVAAETAAPAAAKTTAPVMGAMPKPKLNAQQVAEMLRKEHGSAKAGQMLYGPARPGVTAANRQAAIKRLAPGQSTLPDAAKRAIDKELAGSSAEEAFRYASRAPNAQAQSYMGEMLRKALLDRIAK
jgi:hypothetical protein